MHFCAHILSIFYLGIKEKKFFIYSLCYRLIVLQILVWTARETRVRQNPPLANWASVFHKACPVFNYFFSFNIYLDIFIRFSVKCFHYV